MKHTQKVATQISSSQASKKNIKESAKQVSKPVASWFRGEPSLCVIELG